MMRRKVVERRAILTSQLEQVGSSGRRAQDDARPGALEEHVGDDRGPVNDRFDRVGLIETTHGLLDPFALIGGRARDLERRHRPILRDGDEVGERATDVDADREAAHAADRETTARAAALCGAGLVRYAANSRSDHASAR